MGADERYVMVPALALSDLCDLVSDALRRLDGVEPHDPFQDALRGALAEVRAHSVVDPCGV